MPFAVYALAIAAFAVGTAEFVISGLLPLLSSDLGVSIPTAGLLVTAYAVGVAIGGPMLTVAAARFSQRAVLIGVMILFTFSQVLCAFAPDYGLLMAARVASSIGHGVFFGAGSVVVANLVKPERRGAAFSLFIGGITVANLLGLPGGLPSASSSAGAAPSLRSPSSGRWPPWCSSSASPRPRRRGAFARVSAIRWQNFGTSRSGCPTSPSRW